MKDFKERKQKYCSKACWNIRGQYRRKECVGCGKVGLTSLGKSYCSRDCAYKNMVGEKAAAWKGDNAGYSAIHKWLKDNFESKPECEFCGSTQFIDWANKSQQYLRDRSDWLRLCRKCHFYYDKRDRVFTRKKAVKL